MVESSKALRPRVYFKEDVKPGSPVKEDNYLQKIIKYIPTEIVTAYVTIADLLRPTAPAANTATAPPAGGGEATLLWWIFGILLVLTPIYTYFFTLEKDKPKPIFQTVVSPIAFTAWVFVLGGPFASLKASLHPAIGTIVLIITFIVILIAEKIFIPSKDPNATT